MNYELLTYGLKDLERFFKWGDDYEKTRKMWLIKEVRPEKDKIKVKLFRGYRLSKTNIIETVEEKTVVLTKKHLEALEQALKTRELNKFFRFKTFSDLLSWLYKNNLMR